MGLDCLGVGLSLASFLFFVGEAMLSAPNWHRVVFFLARHVSYSGSFLFGYQLKSISESLQMGLDLFGVGLSLTSF
jgi:hypothetical protein